MTCSHVRLNSKQKYHFINLVESTDLPVSVIVEIAGVSAQSYRRWRRQFQEEGMDGLQSKSKRPGRPKKYDDKTLQDAVFELLHSPPKLYDDPYLDKWSL